MTWSSARPVTPHASPAPREPDPVAVERIAAGQRPARYTAGEMRAAVELLTARGMSGQEVAARIGCTRRTVQRYRRLCEAELVRREWYEAGRVGVERPAGDMTDTTVAVETAEARPHAATRYYDQRSGSYGWRCTCGDSSGPVFPADAAAWAAESHMRMVSGDD